MKNQRKNNLRFLLIILSLIFLFIYSCANQVPPTGGPDDKIPPKIIYNYPENQTLNFSDNKIIIEFDEYVDKKSVTDAFFISPFIKDELEFIWSKRELIIKLPDSLKKDQTFVVSLGTGIRDVRNNQMEKPFNFTFSTGNKIDSCEISGTVFTNRFDNVQVQLFNIEKNEEIDFSNRKADYLGFVDNEGNFTLTGLKEGKYKIIAIKDAYKDFKYNMEQDLIGFYYKDFDLNDSNRVIRDVFIQLTKADTIAPIINSIKVVNSNNIQINFNEALDSSKINLNNFKIEDSLKNEEIKITGFSLGGMLSNVINISMPNTENEKRYRIIINNIFDKSGNNTLIDTLYFSGISDNDTSSPKLLSRMFGNKNEGVDILAPFIYFKFDKNLSENFKLKSAIFLSDSAKNNYEFELAFIDSSSFLIKPTQKLKSHTKYFLDIDFIYIKNTNGFKTDSIYRFEFWTLDERLFGELSGIIKNNNIKVKDSPLILELIPISDFDISLNKIIVKDENVSNFKFNRVREGKYFIRAFIDKNKDSLYTNGNFKKNLFSEPFFIQKDTIKINPRWPIKDYNLDVGILFR